MTAIDEPVKRDLYQDGGEVLLLRWAPDGNEVLVVQEETVRVLRVGDGLTETARGALAGMRVLDVAWVAGAWALLCRDADAVRLRSGVHGREVILEGLDGDAVVASAISPQGGRVAVAVKGPQVGVWSTATGARLDDLRFDPGPIPEEQTDLFGAPKVRELSWSGDGRYLGIWVGYPAHGVLLVDVDTGRHLATLR